MGEESFALKSHRPNKEVSVDSWRKGAVNQAGVAALLQEIRMLADGRPGHLIRHYGDSC